MNAHLKTENLALGVASLRNSRAITCDLRLDGNILILNLHRPELISTSLGAQTVTINVENLCSLTNAINVANTGNLNVLKQTSLEEISND